MELEGLAGDDPPPISSVKYTPEEKEKLWMRPWLRPTSAASASKARPSSERVVRPGSARRLTHKDKDNVAISGKRILSLFKRRAEVKAGVYD
jgi:hypothetical protein